MFVHRFHEHENMCTICMHVCARTHCAHMHCVHRAKRHAQELASLGKRLKTVNEQLQELEEQWLAASAALEALLAGA